MAINSWVDKGNVLHAYDKMLFDKKWNEELMYTTTWKNSENISKWKKPITNDHMLHDSIYVPYSENPNLEGPKVD